MNEHNFFKEIRSKNDYATKQVSIALSEHGDELGRASSSRASSSRGGRGDSVYY